MLRTLVLALVLIACTAYQQRLSLLAMSSRPSYQDLLRRAQDAKAGGAAPPPPIRQQQQQQKAPPAPIQERRSAPQANPDGLPFDDETYDHIKYVISKLTARIKGDTVLSKDELSKFKEAVDAILADSAGDLGTGSSRFDDDDDPDSIKFIDTFNFNDDNNDKGSDGDASSAGYGEEIGSENSMSSKMSVAEPSPPINEAFQELAGRGSGWNVPGQEDMTTEQFYSAVNQRLHRMKAARKAKGQFDYDSARNYEETLNKLNKTA